MRLFTEIMTDHLIIFLGLRRSGNHAVINWFREQANQSIFFNNQKIYKDLSSKNAVSEFPWKFVFVSYEEYGIPHKSKSVFTKRSAFFRPIKKRTNIIVLRDPFNLFASRLRHPKLRRQTLVDSKRWIRRWKSWAREFLGKTNKLSHKYCINFNEWFENYEYRKRIAYDFNLNFTDAGRDKVSRKGHGSSFDGMKYDGKAGRMNVLDRWRVCRKVGEIRAVISHLHQIKRKIYILHLHIYM